MVVSVTSGRGCTRARHVAAFAFCGLSLAGFARLPAEAIARQPQANNDDLGDFRNRLLRIAHDRHVGFAIEGEPRPIVFARLGDRVKALPEAATPGSDEAEEIALVASAYDYSVTRRGPLYVFRKKYTYPQDMPETTPAECSSAAAKIHVVLEQMHHNTGAYDDTQELESLVGSLTSGQWKTLSERHFLLVRTDLTNEQRAAVKDYVLQDYLTGAVGLGEPSVLLDPSNTPRFGRRKNSGKQRDPRLGIIATVATSDGPSDEFSPIPVGAAPAIPPPVGGTSSENADVDEIAIAAEKAAVEQVSHTDNFDISISLQEVVQRLNDRCKNEDKPKSGSGLTFAVDPQLATKRVTLIGDEVASPAEIAAAVASVYALRVQRAPDAAKIQKIARFPTPMIGEPTDGSLIMHEMLPSSLLAALQVDREDALRALPTYNLADTPEKIDLMRKKWGQHQLILEHRRQVMRSAARQLYAIVAPRLQNSVVNAAAEPPEIPIDSLGPYAAAVCSTYLMHAFAENMDTIMYPPWALAHFDQVCFACSADMNGKDGPKAKIGLYMYNEEKQSLGMVMMFTSIPLPTNAPVPAGQ